MDQVVQAFEWKRMLLGDEPPFFLLEIVFRTCVIYLYALILLRWLGSRTIGQLSTIEFLLVIALGSAVGDAMFYPDVPLLHALLVITVVTLANKALDMVIAKSPTAERAVDGVPIEAIRDGVICREFLEGRALSNNELFQQLRQEGVTHLGEVAHAFLETDGALTVFKAREAKPGLPIVPPWEIEAPREIDRLDANWPVVCRQCGMIDTANSETCACCGHGSWVRACTAPEA